jgi:hypothetical protein
MSGIFARLAGNVQDARPSHGTSRAPGRNEPGARFDPDRVDRVLAVFRALRHTKGRLDGQPLIPGPVAENDALRPAQRIGTFTGDIAGAFELRLLAPLREVDMVHRVKSNFGTVPHVRTTVLADSPDRPARLSPGGNGNCRSSAFKAAVSDAIDLPLGRLVKAR